jgi:hypothetical protein
VSMQLQAAYWTLHHDPRYGAPVNGMSAPP